MAHIVPNPPPKWYRDATIAKFSVISWNGAARVVAWGLPAKATDAEYMIAHTDTGYNGIDSLRSEISGGPYKDLKTFTVSGLLAGDKIAIFRNSNFGTPFDPNWVRHSAPVEVASVAADTTAKQLAQGKLPPYANNSNIKLYPFGSLQRKRPLPEADWLRGVRNTLDTIFANALGKRIIQMIRSELIIRPWIPAYANALSDVHFTAQDFPSGQGPCADADAVLFHELIHVLERNYAGYSDKNGFRFDKADFMSVNATNVYSCLKGGGLRKDHKNFEHLPAEYFSNPRKHFDDLKENYDLAKAWSPLLYQTVGDMSRLWNPFIY